MNKEEARKITRELRQMLNSNSLPVVKDGRGAITGAPKYHLGMIGLTQN